jgi:hypothetical protein
MSNNKTVVIKLKKIKRFGRSEVNSQYLTPYSGKGIRA